MAAMRLWRISDFADLSGEGGLLASARWHSRGKRIVYLTDNPASALIEVVVHLEVDVDQFPNSYQLLAVDVPDDITFDTISISDLPADWLGTVEATRELGNIWLESNRTALLCVPSAVVPYTSNWLLNPVHPDAARAQIGRIIRAPFDPRLLR